MRAFLSFFLVVCHLRSLFAFALNVDNKGVGLPKVSSPFSSVGNLGKYSSDLRFGDKKGLSIRTISESREDSFTQTYRKKKDNKEDVQSMIDVQGGFLNAKNSKLLKTERHRFGNVIVKTLANNNGEEIKTNSIEKKRWAGPPAAAAPPCAAAAAAAALLSSRTLGNGVASASLLPWM